MVKDIIGNPITEGCQLAFVQERTSIILAKVIKVHENTVQVPGSGQIPPHVEMVIHMTVTYNPKVSVLNGFAVVVDPKATARVISILEAGNGGKNN